MGKDIVLEMNKYGINTLVQTTQFKIDFYLDLLATEDDAKIGGGVGKKKFTDMLVKELRMRDKAFDLNPSLRVDHPQLWDDFMEDCVILACLEHLLTSRPLPIGTDYELYQMMEQIENTLGLPGVIHSVE